MSKFAFEDFLFGVILLGLGVWGMFGLAPAAIAVGVAFIWESAV